MPKPSVLDLRTTSSKDSANAPAEADHESDRIHREQLLDQALANSFPASDPVSTLAYDAPATAKEHLPPHR